jgi:hypothetical protein
MNYLTRSALLTLLVFNLMVIGQVNAQRVNTGPIRLAVAGITHGHSGWILGRKDNAEITLVGIFEPNADLAQRSAVKYNRPASLIYADLNKMLDAAPEAVVAFDQFMNTSLSMQALRSRHG